MNESKILQIDIYNLEKEWTEQPQLYYKYAVELADAKLRLDEAKRELDVTKAELDTDIRQFPNEYSVAKVTETSVAKALITTDDYQRAVKDVDKLSHEVRMLDAMIWALEHRKKALTSLVELHLANYYSEPPVPKESKQIDGARARRLRSKDRKDRNGSTDHSND